MRLTNFVYVWFIAIALSACSDISKSSYTDETLEEKEKKIQQSELLKNQIAKTPCQTPWGETVLPGAQVLTFKVQSTCSDSCDGESLVRVCENGVLSGSADYSYNSCTASVCASCQLPWGGLLVHGDSTDAYKIDEVSCQSTCGARDNHGTRTCVNGELEGDETLVFGSCQRRACPCPLPWDPDELVPDGTTVNAYRAQTVGCGLTCGTESATRVCADGVFSGDAAFHFENCSTSVCRSCDLPWGGTLPHSETILGFAEANVACGNTCQSSTLSCNDGVLNNPTNAQNATCETGSCACPLPWAPATMVPEGTIITAYSASTVACGGTCSTVSQQRTCVQGQFTGGSNFNREACAPTVCRSCTLPWGGLLPHNETRPGFVTDQVTCGHVCNDAVNSGTVSCNDGTLSNPRGLQRATCQEQTCNCALPWDPLQSIPSGTSITAYDQPAVSCGGSCSPHSQQRTCTNAVLSGSSSYRYQSCEAQCVTCTQILADASEIVLNEGGTIQLSTRERVLACADNCTPYSATIQCNSRVGSGGNYEGYFVITQSGSPGITVPQLRFRTCERDSNVRCSAGGNPPRGCALPGGYGLMKSDAPANPMSRLYLSRYDRPPHTQEPMNRRAYLNVFQVLNDLYPFGFREARSTTTGNEDWYYHVSPDTVLTFYDTPVVDKRLPNQPESCDARARAKRCDPDGYWVEVNAPSQDRGGIGPFFGPDDLKPFKYTSCETIPADAPDWSTRIRNIANCLADGSLGACLFDKNPFAANANVIPTPAQMPALQRTSIDWTDPKSSGFLISESFRVLEFRTTDVGYCMGWYVPLLPGEDPSTITPAQIAARRVNTGIRKRYSGGFRRERLESGTSLPANPVSRRLSYANNSPGFTPVNNSRLNNVRDYPALRVQLFYTLENFKRTLLDRFGTGAIHFAERGLYAIQGDPLFSNNAAFVFGNAPFFGFGPKIDLVINGSNIQEVLGMPTSQDQSVIAHELGHANLYYATGANVLNSSTSRYCGTRDSTTCCQTVQGCFAAIHEGQADFFAALFFPDNPTIGDGFANSVAGASNCGISRDPRVNTSLTFAQAFSACGPDLAGQSHAMGTVYASMWWELRQQSTPAERFDLERLFLEHLKYLSSGVRFADTLAAVRQAEMALFGNMSTWSPRFETELNRR